MRLCLLLAAALALAAPAALGAGTFKVSIAAKTHEPRANARWNYTVRAVDAAGKAVRGRLTVEVVDPLGGTHAVTYGTTTKPIRNWPFTGVFRDFARWPGDSKGFTLTLRATVRAGAVARRAEYDNRVR